MCGENVVIVLVDRDYYYSSFMMALSKDSENSKKEIKIIDRAIKKIKTKKGFTRFCNWIIGRKGKELDNDCWLIKTKLKNIDHKLDSEYIQTIRYLYIKNVDTELAITLSVRRCDIDNVLNQDEMDVMLIPDSWRKFVGKDISWD